MRLGESKLKRLDINVVIKKDKIRRKSEMNGLKAIQDQTAPRITVKISVFILAWEACDSKHP